MILDVPPATTDDTKLIVDRLNQIAEDAAKPKSLAEIYALVGSFPFKAKAINPLTTKAGWVFPVGSILTCLASTSDIAAYAIEPFVVNGLELEYADNKVRRWLLVEE